MIGGIVRQMRRVRPDVVVTFPPDGAYGHPDHVAISQFTAAATVAAADANFRLDPADGSLRPHSVAKLYYLAWPQSTWDAYQEAFRQLVSHVDGVTRQAVPWPDWALTTAIDTRAEWQRVWQAVSCTSPRWRPTSGSRDLSPAHHRGVVGLAVVLSRLQPGEWRTID